jgi:hypothetical protein
VKHLSGALGYVLGLTQKHFNNKLVFAPGKPFQPTLMFIGKAICSTLGRLLALLTNNRLGWKDLPRTNPLAYYVNS